MHRAGDEVHLTPTEWGLLRALLTYRGRTMTHQQLFRAVWGQAAGDAQQYLRVYVGQLRRKLERDPVRPLLIKTGAGSRLSVRAVTMNSPTTTRARQWLLWFAVLAGATVLLLLFRGRLDKAHFALVFLLVVLGGSAAGGRALGITLAGAAFLVFDVGFLPPYNTVLVADWADWIVLIVFLITGIVAAELLERQRHEA